MSDEQDIGHNPDKEALSLERRARLGRSAAQTTNYNPHYSRFIRRAKLVLPLVALMISAVVFAWSSMNDKNMLPTPQQAGMPRNIGKNELLNPRFESKDDKQQPYTITAARALQGEKNENLVILEKPVADMMLTSGNWVAIEADQGAFQQNDQKLLLRGNVRLFHDKGYHMETALLHIDIANNKAWSEEEVRAQGPAGTLSAKGLQASADDGHLIFTGPAKLVLMRETPQNKNGTVAQ